jgi:hypothetical protein
MSSSSSTTAASSSAAGGNLSIKTSDGAAVTAAAPTNSNERKRKTVQLESNDFHKLNELVVGVGRAYKNHLDNLGSFYYFCGAVKNFMDKMGLKHNVTPSSFQEYDRQRGTIGVNEKKAVETAMKLAARRARAARATATATNGPPSYQQTTAAASKQKAKKKSHPQKSHS